MQSSGKLCSQLQLAVLLTCRLPSLTFLSLFTPQAADAELPPPPANSAAHYPGSHQLLPHAHLHDLQWVPMHRSSSGGWDRILSLQLEEGSGSGHHRALPLTSDSTCGLIDCCRKHLGTERYDSPSNHPFSLLSLCTHTY